MKTFEVDEMCPACGGTGLYVGMGENDGAAVVCRKCKGTGKYHFVHRYEEFKERKEPTKEVRRVFECNPGISIGEDENRGILLSSFGGIPFSEWKDGKPFPRGSEMRKFTCPAWWYQSADYKKKPKWGACIGCGIFSGCEAFVVKENCWERWDKENKDED